MKNLVTVVILFLFTFATAFTQVVVTPASNGEDLPQSTSCGNGDPGGYHILDNIQINESDVGDFISSGSLLLFAPTGWQFNTASMPFPSITSFSPAGVEISLSSIETNRITLILTVNNQNVQEGIIISNVQVQAILCNEMSSFLGNIELFSFAQINGIGMPENMGTLSVDPDSPLPVELASFSAILKDKEVLLNWSTATEVNNYGFDVERMRDGEDWKALGFVEGNGNSNSPKDYSFVDNNVSNAGTYYYRLKQIDNDGTYEYSNQIEVDFEAPNSLELNQNYPNPFNPSTTISFKLPEPGIVTLKIYNLLGEEIASLVDNYKQAGIHTFNFNAEGLPSGMYLYRLSTNGFTETKKMLFMK